MSDDDSDSDFVMSSESESEASIEEPAPAPARPRSTYEDYFTNRDAVFWDPPSRGRYRRELRRLGRAWAWNAVAGAFLLLASRRVWRVVRALVAVSFWMKIPDMVPDPQCHRYLRWLPQPHPKALNPRFFFVAFALSRLFGVRGDTPLAIFGWILAYFLGSGACVALVLWLQYGLVDNCLLGLITATYSPHKRQQFVAVLWRIRAWTT